MAAPRSIPRLRRTRSRRIRSRGLRVLRHRARRSNSVVPEGPEAQWLRGLSRAIRRHGPPTPVRATLFLRTLARRIQVLRILSGPILRRPDICRSGWLSTRTCPWASRSGYCARSQASIA